MSAQGMTLTVLATELSVAIGKDGAGHPVDIGPNVAAVLRTTASALVAAQREAAAYKWAYGYLQDRMRSLGRHGWAMDCDGEIEARIATEEPSP